MILLLLFSFHTTLSIDAFSTMNLEGEEPSIHLSPISNVRFKYGSFKFFGTGGYIYSSQEGLKGEKWMLYQSYLRIFLKKTEIKGGKTVYIPGFPNLFNIYSRKFFRAVRNFFNLPVGNNMLNTIS
mgnify:CR=1 FL=1